MIRRPRDLSSCPPELSDVNSPAAKERKKAEDYYTKVPAPTENMKFSVYSEDEVKDRLNRLFGYKCAYCESDFGAAMPVDVEHFRPKGGVIDANGVFRFPGYWWLASTWENLLPSCIDCNRNRWQREGSGRYKRGKENLFPLDGGAFPATDAAGVANEVPLLINPCDDRPDDHLVHYYGVVPGGRIESVVRPSQVGARGEDRRGRASIDTYGLNRNRLAISRKKTIERLISAIDAVETIYGFAEQEADAARAAAMKAKGRTQIKRLTSDFLHWRNPYAAAARAYFRDWLVGFKARHPVP